MFLFFSFFYVNEPTASIQDERGKGSERTGRRDTDAWNAFARFSVEKLFTLKAIKKLHRATPLRKSAGCFHTTEKDFSFAL